MTNQKIKQVLDLHYIMSRFEGDQLIALEVYGDGSTEDINVTGWTKQQVLDWLGY